MLVFCTCGQLVKLLCQYNSLNNKSQSLNETLNFNDYKNILETIELPLD